MKYLGIYFHIRLTFHKYIEHIVEKSRTLIYMLSRSAKRQWGLGHKSLKMVYEGALVPLMTYGAPSGRKLLLNKDTSARCKVYRCR